VWTKDPRAERLSTISAYVQESEVRRESWQRRVASGIFEAEPNPAHHALVELERLGRLELLVTQNIDGLHHAAGSSPERVVEVHGTVLETTCLDCGWRGPSGPVLERVRAGDDDPACHDCGGILKSATISFGQPLVAADLQRAHDAAASCDVFLALGTSLAVYPVAALPEVAVANGATLVIANAEPTPFDVVANAVLRADVGSVLTRLVDDLRDRLRAAGRDRS
jgi:NAD-dependent deacetylase